MVSSSSLSYQPGGEVYSTPTSWPMVSPVADPVLYTVMCPFLSTQRHKERALELADACLALKSTRK